MESVGVRIGPVTVLTTTVTLECVYNQTPESPEVYLETKTVLPRADKQTVADTRNCPMLKDVPRQC